ncbi:effector binding domain-containing protein [Paenibacillus spongiae]|uniref:Effector binding domain-containing protein n=1 Tax=Paenibacillus spongiae TaxID=2909671 RepID=A0ABY5SB14_9BACL|nr:effector binding domain-containing protein [Paenibacillus spongiae]UVI30854.1 effector binding domain-containing protein [Paenibacillus spongiae]
MTVQINLEELIQVRTAVTEKVHLVGLKGANDYEVEKRMFAELKARNDEIPNRIGADEYLVIFGDGLLVAAQVTEFGQLPEGMTAYTLEPDEHAVFRFEEKHICAFWEYFCSPDNQAKYNLNIDKPRFEIFKESLQPAGMTEIYFPTHDREVKVLALGELKLVGLRVICKNGGEYKTEIPKAAAELKRRIGDIDSKTEPQRMIGVFVPGDYSQQEDGYWVCVQVDDVASVPEGMTSLIVPPQSYAVTLHKGRIDMIFRTYELLHHWIAEHGYERIQRSWHLEIYEQWGTPSDTVEVMLHDTITV